MQAAEALFFHGNLSMVDYTPLANTPAGSILNLGNGLVGITHVNIPANRKDAASISGIYKVRKEATDTFARGDVVGWDDTAKTATDTIDGSGDDFALGVVVQPAVNGDDFVLVSINQVRGTND